MPNVAYDYDLQAWYDCDSELVLRCGHTDAMACVCVGRLYQGENVGTVRSLVLAWR